VVIEVIISSGRPTGTAATIADEAVRLFGECLRLAPHDIPLLFLEVEPNHPRFPAASIRRDSERGYLSRDIGNLRPAASRQQPSFADYSEFMGRACVTIPFSHSLQGQLRRAAP
jgi:hypothetical protein